MIHINFYFLLRSLAEIRRRRDGTLGVGKGRSNLISRECYILLYFFSAELMSRHSLIQLMLSC